MDAALIDTARELPPAPSEQRDAERMLVDKVSRGEAVVILRLADGSEQPVSGDDLRAFLAVVSARATGHRVSVVVHEEMLSPQRAADMLGVSRPMVYRLIERGELAAIRIGTHWRIRSGEVLRLADERQRLAAQVDSGLAAALATGNQNGRQVDAKVAWYNATDDERAQALALVRAIDDGPES